MLRAGGAAPPAVAGAVPAAGVQVVEPQVNRTDTGSRGGLVEGYPQDTPGKKVNPSFLYNGTRHMYEEAGFTYDRPKGKNHCVMTRVVDPVS